MSREHKCGLQVFRLVKNELVKLCTRKLSFFVFLIILLVASAYSISFKSLESGGESKNWKKDVQQDITNIKDTLNQPYGIKLKAAKESFINQIKVYEYMLEHNIKPLKKLSAGNFLLSINKIFTVIVLLVIILAGKITADEYRYGTIHNLLATPCKRWKILLSKLITIFIVSVVTIVGLYLFIMIVGMITFGYSPLSEKVVTYADGGIRVHSVLVQSIIENLYNLYVLLACSMLVSMLTIVTKNGTFATCASIILYLTSGEIAWAFHEEEKFKYTLPANFDFQMYKDGTAIFKGMSPSFSICVILVHTLIFCVISLLVFYRKRL